MADSKITDLALISSGTLDRDNDVLVVVDVSATEDKKITPQRLFTDTPATTSNAGSMSASDKTKLDGVATGATANSSDAFLLNRTNHTGTQDGSTIVSNSITNTQIRQSVGTSVIGRSTGTTGNVADIVASADGQFLGRTSGTLSFSVPPVFTASSAGYAPASGGGTTNFLRADGTWAAPPGGGGSSPLTTKGDIFTRDSSADARLAVGSNGYTLIANSSTTTGLEWRRGFYVASNTNTSSSLGAATTETVAFSYTIPGNTLGANGIVRVIAMVANVQSATTGTRTVRIRWGGISGTIMRLMSNTSTSTSRTTRIDVEIANRNSTSSQIGRSASGGDGGLSTGGAATASLNTASDVDVVVTVQGISGDVWTANFFLVEICPS